MPSPTYDLLDSTTLASSASSVTFSSISQDYRDLVLVIESKADPTSTNFILRPNSDSSNGTSVIARGNGTTTSSFTSGSSINLMAFGGEAANAAFLVVQIMDYSATDKHKAVLSRGNNANQVASMAAGRWASTSAITSLQIFNSTADAYAAGSTFRLFGIAA